MQMLLGMNEESGINTIILEAIHKEFKMLMDVNNCLNIIRLAPR